MAVCFFHQLLRIIISCHCSLSGKIYVEILYPNCDGRVTRTMRARVCAMKHHETLMQHDPILLWKLDTVHYGRYMEDDNYILYIMNYHTYWNSSSQDYVRFLYFTFPCYILENQYKATSAKQKDIWSLVFNTFQSAYKNRILSYFKQTEIRPQHVINIH